MAKMTVTWHSNTREVGREVEASALAALRDVTYEIHGGASKNHPYTDRTGNNTRSITPQVGNKGQLSLSENQSAVFSTSGYGGFLETGTRFMGAYPYIYPAVVQYFTPTNLSRRLNNYLSRKG